MLQDIEKESKELKPLNQKLDNKNQNLNVEKYYLKKSSSFKFQDAKTSYEN